MESGAFLILSSLLCLRQVPADHVTVLADPVMILVIRQDGTKNVVPLLEDFPS